MNHHLDPEEILRVADKEVANGTLTAAMEHLAVCPRCRREVDFQRELRRAAERLGTSRVSRDFTSRVLQAVGAPARKGMLGRLSDNLGSVFALMMVIGLFGLVSSAVPSFDRSDTGASQGVWDAAVHRLAEVSGQVSSIAQSLQRPAQPLAPAAAKEFIAPVALACLLLFVTDLAVRNYFRHRTREHR